MNWWDDHEELARFLRWLHHERDMTDVREAIWVVEAPHHWDAEYQEMCREQQSPSVARANARLADGEDLVGDLEASLQYVRAHKAGGGR